MIATAPPQMICPNADMVHLARDWSRAEIEGWNVYYGKEEICDVVVKAPSAAVTLDGRVFGLKELTALDAEQPTAALQNVAQQERLSVSESESSFLHPLFKANSPRDRVSGSINNRVYNRFGQNPRRKNTWLCFFNWSQLV